MVRIDAWDVQKPDDYGPIDCGFPRDFSQRYAQGKYLGKGGFGKVCLVTETRTGKEFACKSISKRLDVPNFSIKKQAAHLDNIKREIAVLRRLKGSLTVAQLKEALEDDDSVHIVMEYCRGGELWSSIYKLRHYSEETVASYMRAVLRTVAQCHVQCILHRDVKSGNFMLLDNDPLSPVKAIDFGMAMFFEPSKLPRRDLGLEGTPWFMSPETLSSQVGPPSDVWAAGVMAYQLLSGYLPFDDHKNRDAPALSKVWKAILTDPVAFQGSAWEQVSQPAKDFVRALLNKDPDKRPSAKAALQHKWLVGGHKADRNKGMPLQHTVIQRIQRYGQGNILKRTIFDLIAQEIIKMAPDTPEPSSHSRAAASPGALSPRDRGVGEDEDEASARAAHLFSSIKRRKSQRALAALSHAPGGGAMEWPPLIHRDHHSVHGGMEYYQARGESVHNGKQLVELAREGRPSSVHGSSSYWRVMRAAATALKWKSDSVHAKNSYLRYMPRCEDEREEQRKAARIALDTSFRGSEGFEQILKQCSTSRQRLQIEESMSPDDSRSGHVDSKRPRSLDLEASKPRKVIPETSKDDIGAVAGEQRVRGKHAYRQFLFAQGGSREAEPAEEDRKAANGAAPVQVECDPKFPRTATTPGTLSQLAANSTESPPRPQAGRLAIPKHSPQRSVTFSCDDSRAEGGASQQGQRTELPRTIGIAEMKDLMRKLNFTREAAEISEEALADGLAQLGYRLRPDEMQILAKQMDPHNSAGAISKSAFLASQIDWHNEDLRELWVEAAKRVFADLEKNSEGKLSFAALISMVREKVSEAEVEYAIEDALVQAGYADEEEMDFDGFLRVLRAEDASSLDHFEARLGQHLHDSRRGFSPPPALSTVAEGT